MGLTLDELHSLKRSLNDYLANLRVYESVETSKVRLEDAKVEIKKIEIIIEKVAKQIDYIRGGN